MAKKRRKRRASGARAPRHSELSEETKKGIAAIIIALLGIISLLGFFGLAGKIGYVIDDKNALLFGWNRWLFDLILIILAWELLRAKKNILRFSKLFGLIIFFISFNGLLNLLLTDINVLDESELSLAGGYVGTLFSYLLVSWTGFWGTMVIALAFLAISIMILFNISVESILNLQVYLQDLHSLLGRNNNEEEEEEDDEEDTEEEIDEEETDDDREEENRPITHKRKMLPAFSNNDAEEEESIMTSKRRRKMEIPLDLLNDNSVNAKAGDIERNEEIIQHTFENFGIEVEMAGVKIGPTVTQYALKPAEGVKLSRIVALQDDLALALAAHPIRIEAPIPGKSLVGIEVPNQKIGMVTLRELLSSKAFKKRKTNFTAPLGKDVGGNVQMISVDKAPHMLVAGATGSGKSVCLNSIILSLLYQNGPDDLKLIMVDPKRVELGVYKGIPHLLVPPITKVEEALNALKWAVREMERRLDHLAKSGARDIDSYNAKSKERMPKIIIVIDELADLMSQSKRDVEAVIVRIAQMARAVGIHLILATQRPSVDVITGLIKANIPTRIAFAVASQVDSKTILDQAGAEKLLGRGDMLLTSPQISKPKRAQGALVTEKEIEAVVNFLKEHGEPDYNYSVTEDSKTGGTAFSTSSDSDPLLDEAIKVVIESGRASTSLLQRRLKVGYSRAARIIDIMEEMGVVGPSEGAKGRQVLVESWPPGEESGDIEENIADNEYYGGEIDEDLDEYEEDLDDYDADEEEFIDDDEEEENNF